MIRNQIFATLGRISIYFATLEGKVHELLCFLIDREAWEVGATLIERNPLSKNLVLLKKLARGEDSDTKRRVNNALGLIEPLRIKRNLFVHGIWNVSPRLVDQGKVKVTSRVLTYVEKGNSKSWSGQKTEEFSLDDLRAFETKVMHALKVSIEALEKIESEE